MSGDMGMTSIPSDVSWSCCYYCTCNSYNLSHSVDLRVIP